MNGTEKETRIKRLKYRANHRGIKEMDIILGGFANACLDEMTESELDDFEMLMAEQDRDLLIWFTGEEEFPLVQLHNIFDRINQYMLRGVRHA